MIASCPVMPGPNVADLPSPPSMPVLRLSIESTNDQVSGRAAPGHPVVVGKNPPCVISPGERVAVALDTHDPLRAHPARISWKARLACTRRAFHICRRRAAVRRRQWSDVLGQSVTDSQTLARLKAVPSGLGCRRADGRMATAYFSGFKTLLLDPRGTTALEHGLLSSALAASIVLCPMFAPASCRCIFNGSAAKLSPALALDSLPPRAA